MNSEKILYKIKKYKKLLLQNNLIGGNNPMIQYKLDKYNNMLGGDLTNSDIDKVSSDVKNFIETNIKSINYYNTKIKKK